MVVHIYSPNIQKTTKGLEFEASLGNSKILSQKNKNKQQKKTHIHTNQFFPKLSDYLK